MGLLMVPFGGKICGLDPPTVFQSKMNTVIVLGASWGTVLRNQVTYLNSTDFGSSEGWKWIGHTPSRWHSGTWKELVFKTFDIQPCHFSKGTLSHRSSPNLLHDMKLLLPSHTSIIKAQMQKKTKSGHKCNHNCFSTLPMKNNSKYNVVKVGHSNHSMSTDIIYTLHIKMRTR